MGWREDAQTLLDDDEPLAPDDWRESARSLLATPEPRKPASTWRDDVAAFLQAQEVAPLGPEVDVVQRGMRANLTGQPAPVSPPGATPLERQVIAQAPATRVRTPPAPFQADIRQAEQGRYPQVINPIYEQIAA